MTVKLLMNSLHGRTNTVATETVVVPNARWENYQSFNYHWIQSTQHVGGNWYVEMYATLDSQFNHVQCGVEVLSTSNQIMNRARCFAEDERLSIFYQDTGNMHTCEEEVPLLAEVFRANTTAL